MTALAMVRCEDGIMLASDGACYDPKTGRLGAKAPKVVLMPDLSCIMAGQGQGMVAEFAHAHLRGVAALGGALDGFDDVLEHLPRILRDLDAEGGASAGEQTEWLLLVGGYSDRRERWESYLIHNGPRCESVIGALYALIPIPTYYFTPGPTAEAARRVGLDMDALGKGAFKPSETVLRAVCAARLMPGLHFEGRTVEAFGVGGYLQLTSLTRLYVSSGIVHRWPDERGDFIAPSDDDLPDFLRPQTADESPQP